ncbi:MAG TPA: aminopeptidase [Thermoanaerobaculaceae bacterium]|nr:aminopeptidase [Thermoanaerobaculaceae bacterium]HPS78423.1 aminopeptidase [Thermoanaerobaculaceae bacterium]
MTAIESAALTAVRDCLGLKPSETLLVLTDPPLLDLARVLVKVARPLAREVLLTEYTARELHGQEPPPPIPALMAAVDVVLAVTTRSITHTAARRTATASGTRVAAMPGITEDCLIRTMNANYRAIAERTNRVAEMLTRAHLARVTTDLGTDLALPIDGIAAIASTGLILHRSQWGDLPSGEAYLRPQEGKSEGVAVVDGSLAGTGTLHEPIRIKIREGVAVGVDGGEQAQSFAAQLERVGPLARSVAELGVGTNDKAIVTGNILEDEKILGTVHVAFGNNTSMGGAIEVPFHVDGIILNPTLTLDGHVVLDRGIPRF